jgi:NAD(P)-dependent dehydrogenase (short-subunit alcohol dehydrogenase family)
MSEHPPQVAIVTGASRGAGKGIAIGLGSQGMTVYVTGREKSASGGKMLGRDLPGTLEETAAAVTRAGGKGVAAVCDSARDDDLRALVERVVREAGRIDILHNNATYIHDRLVEPGPFWEKPLEFVRIIDVGLRSAYVASWYAAPVMVKQGRGLISFSSSFGGNCYMHGPAYGAQKAGVDKLAADMAVDLENTGVAAVSLWLGPQKTERSVIAVEEKPEQYTGFMAVAETPEFNGRVLYALARDPKLVSRSGQTLITAELAQEYGIRDEGDRQPPSYREALGAPRVPHPARVM